LRATLDWSYALLSEAERLLLNRLSVFAGGWTLSAAEAVCGGDEVEGWEVADLLNQLQAQAPVSDCRMPHCLLLAECATDSA
jgi:predicted ATPase